MCDPRGRPGTASRAADGSRRRPRTDASAPPGAGRRRSRARVSVRNRCLSLLCAPTSSPGKMCRRPRPRSSTYSAVQRPTPRRLVRRSITAPILELLKGLQVETIGDDRLGDLDDRASLGGAEAVALDVVCIQACERLRVRECARAVGTVGRRLSAVGGEAVQQLDPDRERQLLAGDAIDQRFEDGGEARRLEAPHTCGERAEQRVWRGHRGEGREVDRQSDEPVECAAHELLRRLIDLSAREHDRQMWRVRAGHLSHRQCNRSAGER